MENKNFSHTNVHPYLHIYLIHGQVIFKEPLFCVSINSSVHDVLIGCVTQILRLLHVFCLKNCDAATWQHEVLCET